MGMFITIMAAYFLVLYVRYKSKRGEGFGSTSNESFDVAKFYHPLNKTRS